MGAAAQGLAIQDTMTNADEQIGAAQYLSRAAMSANGVAPSPVEIARSAFVNLVTQLNQQNGANPDWWLTWLSCRDRVQAKVWDGLLEQASARREADRAAPRSDVTIKLWLLDHWSLAKHVGLAMWRLAAARRFPSRPREKADVMVVTILSEQALVRVGPYQDVYFGRLHEWLKAAGERVLICGFPEGHPGRIAAAAARREDVRVVTFGQYLSLRDLGRALLSALRARVRVPALPLWWGGDAGGLVRMQLRRERISIFEGVLVRRAMARLLAEHPQARVIHMYENNAWERASYQAAKSATPPRHVTGYLHCAVLPSHLKNVFPANEPKQRPRPDRVVTTGPAASRVLASLGDHPDGLVVDGCSLRLPLLSAMAGLPAPRRPIRTVLAVFEGLESVVPAAQQFFAAARQRPELRFLVRCHPQLPIERLSALAGFRYGPGEAVDASGAASLEAAVAEADVVVYVSSTAALYALYGGRPVIKIDNDPLDDDPLTACSSFKWRAANAAELLSALDAINAIPPDVGAAAMEAARDYLNQYLRTPSPTSLQPFLGSARNAPVKTQPATA
jgi:hypothetical protein